MASGPGARLIPFGGIGFDNVGNATFKLLDKTGRVVWSENGKPSGRPLGDNVSK